MIYIHKVISSLFADRIGDNAIELEASGREEMFTWLQELQARRKDIIKQHRASARAQVILYQNTNHTTRSVNIIIVPHTIDTLTTT